MEYSKNLDASPRKITFPTRKNQDQDIESFDDLAALVLAAQDADDRPPPDVSPDGYTRILDILDSLDAITAPAIGLGKIATNNDHDDEPQAQVNQPIAGASVSSSPVRHLHPSTSTPSTPSRPTTTTTAHRRQQPTTAAPVTAWKHLDEHLKFNEACRVAEDLEGMTFSLDLSARVERTLWTHPDPCRLLSGYINKALRDHGIAGTPFAFAVEYAPLQENHRGDVRSKLHLHGVVVSDDPAKVKAALLAAGGKIASKSRSRQVKLAQIDVKRGGGIGWAMYALKDEDRTWRHIDGERVMFINENLRRLAREQWQERRQVKRRRPKTAVVTHTTPPTTSDELPAALTPEASQRPPMAVSGIPAIMAEVARVTALSHARRRSPHGGRPGRALSPG